MEGKSKYIKSNGEGGNKYSNPKKVGFRPLIATSLALALGVSCAYSVQCTNTSSSDAPILCYTDNGNPVTSPTINWVTATDNTYYKPQTNSQDVSPAFQFGASDANITLQSNGKGIKIGEGGNGTLTVNFNGQNGKVFTLDLSNVSNSQYAFIGNITTSYGSSKSYNGDRRFVATFDRSVKGNITLNSGGKATGANGIPNALTFNNGAKLEGNLSVGYEDTGIVFSGTNGGITGSLTKNNTGGLTINFDSSGGYIGQNVSISGGQNNTNININNLTSIGGNVSLSSSTNNLAFLGEGANIGGNISLFGGSTTTTGNTLVVSNGITARSGSINFQTSTTINNGIVVNAPNPAHTATITFSNNATINSNSSTRKSISNTISVLNINFNGNISELNGIIYAGDFNYQNAGYGARNNISFATATTNATINGDILSRPFNGNSYVSRNAVIFNGNGNNAINGRIRTAGMNSKTLDGYSANNVVKFTAGTNTINGIIQSLETGYGRGAKNEVVLSGTSNIIKNTSSIKALDDSGNEIAGTENAIVYVQGGAFNTITFNGVDVSENTMQGDIIAKGSAYTNSESESGTNTISFSGSSNRNQIIGKIFSSGGTVSGGKNTITFTNTKDNGVNSIEGAIQSSWGTNSITFTSGTTNIITGDITASGGNNTISFGANSSSIVGNLSATGGTNTITFGGSTNTLGGNGANYTISANGSSNGGNTIVANNGINFENITSISVGAVNNAGGYVAKNLFDLQGTINFNNSNPTIIAGNTGNNNSAKYNILKFGGEIGGNPLSISELTAVSTTNGGGNLANTKNILSFDNLSATTTLSIADINKTDSIGNNNQTAYNYIGKNLTTGNAGTLDLNFTESDWHQDMYQASNLSLNISNNIYAKYGKNFINVESINVNGIIDGNGGTNNIATNALTANTIQARWGGNNNIVVGGNGVITNITTSIDEGDNNNRSSNNLTFNGANATHSVSGNIIANAGSNTLNFAGSNATFSMTEGSSILSISGNGNNTLNIQDNTKITSNLVANRTAGNGKNIFKISDNKTLTLADSNNIAKTLTTTSGETSIVFIGNNSTNGSGTFGGNVTTGVTSTPSLPAEEARNTSLAKTTITFADSGTKTSTAALLGTLTAQNGGINEINITNDLALKVDSTNALKLNGNTQGNNNIVLGSSTTALTINKNNDSGVSHIDTIGGNTNITLSGQNEFTLTSAGIGTYGKTTEGATTTINLNVGADGINFKLFDNGASNGIIYSGGENEGSLGKTIISFKDNATSTLTADIQTADYGITIFNLGSTSATTATATLNGTIENTRGKNIFNVNAKTATLQADSLSFSSGTNEINFANTTGATLSWKNSDGTTTQTISTTANGTTNINFNNSGTIAGGSETASIDTNGATASTTITLANLPQTPTEGVEGRVRNANGVSAVIQGAVTTTSGTTTIKFASGDSAKTLTLGGSGNTITDFAFDTSGNSTNNTIILSQGTTTFSGDSLSVESTNAIAFNLENNTTLTLTNELTTNGGETTFNFNGDIGTLTLGSSKSISTTSGTTTFNLGSSTSVSQNIGSATITIDGQIGNTNGTQDGSGQYNGGENFFSVNAKNVTLKNGDSGLTFDAGLNVIEFANTSGATLNWKDKDGNAQAIQTTSGSTTIRFSNSGTIDGAVSTTGGNTTFEIDNNAYAVVTGNVTTGSVNSGGSQSSSAGGMTPRAGTASTNVDFIGNGALVLRGTSNNISNVILGSGTYILSLTDGISNGGAEKRDYRRTLVIDNITTGSGSLILGTQTTTSQADTFIIKGASGDKQGTYHFGIIAEDGIKLDEIGTGESGAVRLASVADGSGISFESKSKVISGFTEATADITHATTDENGNAGSGYTSYYIGKVSDAEVIAAEQEITATAFTLNYDLYMANLNSLNKRMGELRDNAHSQGVWARVFNGALSNEFGLGSKSNYTTIQAGYDYAFGFEGANNYLGVALSYALSTSTSQNAFDSEGQKRGIDNVYSNAVEVALYNSYVSDSGWYNDTIAKFSYIMSKFDISNLNIGSVTNNDTTNFALTLGDEVGYVFKLGENKEWSITPQIEATFGYFNQSDFKQTLANSTAYLASSADAVLTLRTRVGSAFAYDFKNFTQKDTFNASLYVGAFYEYDYVSGGGITLSTDQINGVENILSDLNSDGRVVMNVGTNMSIKDNTRLYFDFEKSFAGKITTDYQVNFGVRYSFGESNEYTPMIEKSEFKAPLKVEGEESKEGDSETKEESEKTQESKEAEKTTDKTQDKSTKDKTQEKKAQ